MSKMPCPDMTHPIPFDETFPGHDLDPTVWFASYLPAWSSKAASAATYEVRDSELRLSIPPGQPLWCPDLHDPPLRVSAVQSGNWSGPVGSMQGQQPFRSGLTVREAQTPLFGFTPYLSRIEVTCRATLSPRSMFSAWMIGIEDQPNRCGEICIVEIFGKDLPQNPTGHPTAQIGCGIHAFRDPALTEDFAAPTIPLDITVDHTYAVDWTESHVAFSVDGHPLRTCSQSPAYPMQLILAVFDFPAWATPDDPNPPTPELIVTRVRGDSSPT
jgi:hypothetical protein